MNTVDRSLTALDFAMRRRFEFELVSPEPDLVSNNMAGVDVQALLIRLNARIKLLLGSGYEFGHAFFMESRISSVQKSEHWLGLADGELRALAHILRANIFPRWVSICMTTGSKCGLLLAKHKPQRNLSLYLKNIIRCYFSRSPI